MQEVEGKFIKKEIYTTHTSRITLVPLIVQRLKPYRTSASLIIMLYIFVFLVSKVIWVTNCSRCLLPLHPYQIDSILQSSIDLSDVLLDKGPLLDLGLGQNRSSTILLATFLLNIYKDRSSNQGFILSTLSILVEFIYINLYNI